MPTQTRNIYFKSDFQVLLESEAGWGGVPFRLLFYTNVPSRAFVACFDDTTYHHCHLHEDGRLCVGFDDHGLGLGVLMMEARFYLDNACYESGICDEVIPAAPVTVTPIDPETGEPEVDPETGELVRVQLQLSLQGASTLETIGTLPAYYQVGPAGPQGAQGPQGPQGEPGRDGEDGAPGTLITPTYYVDAAGVLHAETHTDSEDDIPMHIDAQGNMVLTINSPA